MKFVTLLTLLSACSSSQLVFAAPQHAIIGKNLECGRRLPRLQNVAPRLQWRVGNGFDTRQRQWPWMVSLLRNDGIFGHICGGSLIHRRFVLTAAHCIYGDTNSTQRYRVRLGNRDHRDLESGEFDTAIEKIIMHPEYYMSVGGPHDIALLKLDKDLPLGNSINVVCLPKRNRSSIAGKILTIIGWGSTTAVYQPPILQQTEVPILDEAACNQSWSTYVANGTYGRICAAVIDSRSSCSGDSGGPVMLYEDGRWTQYGIVSAGTMLCGSNAVPSLHVDVAYYENWIRNTIALESQSTTSTETNSSTQQSTLSYRESSRRT